MTTTTYTDAQLDAFTAAGREIMQGHHEQGATDRLTEVSLSGDIELLEETAQAQGLDEMPNGYSGDAAWKAVFEGIEAYADEHGLA
ncbi:MAG: hypothetical protein AAGC60_00235 [Acidobacteriota bacterium]